MNFFKRHFIEHVEIFKKHFPFLHSLTRKDTTKTRVQKFSIKFPYVRKCERKERHSNLYAIDVCGKTNLKTKNRQHREVFHFIWNYEIHYSES